jgi:glucose-1-phosphate thymidylyltransferase
VVADDATVENTTIGDNVHVMAGAEVIDSSLERSLVFPETTVEDSALSDTIVDRESLVRGLELMEARIGAYSRLP